MPDTPIWVMDDPIALSIPVDVYVQMAFIFCLPVIQGRPVLQHRVLSLHVLIIYARAWTIFSEFSRAEGTGLQLTLDPLSEMFAHRNI